MDYELEDVTNSQFTDTQSTPKDLKRTKSTRRVGRMTRPLERKTNLYTSNGFSLAYLSPSKNRKTNQDSSIHKIEQSISKFDDRNSFDPRHASTPKQPPSISSVYENKKKLNDYHRNMKGDKSTISSKNMDTCGSEKSSVASTKNGKVNDYPYHGIRRMENFSQKLHTISNSHAAKMPNKDSKILSTNDHIRERLDSDTTIKYQPIGGCKEILDNITAKGNSRKYNPKRLQKCKSINDNEIKDNISISSASTQFKRKKSETTNKVNNKSSYTSEKNGRDKSNYGSNTDRPVAKKTTSRLSSRMRSPKNKPPKGRTSIYPGTKTSNYSGKDSSTAKSLEKAKAEQIEALKKKELKYISTIKQLDSEVNDFKKVAAKMQQRLQKADELMKKCNQFNLVFLNYYKDFEKFVQEENSNQASFEESKYQPLQDHLRVCLNLLDFEEQEDGSEINESIFSELDDLCKKYEEHSKKKSDIGYHKASNSKLS